MVVDMLGLSLSYTPKIQGHSHWGLALSQPSFGQFDVCTARGIEAVCLEF